MLDLDTLATGIGMRDQHMKEKYLEIAKFKSAVLRLKQIELPGAVFVPASGTKVTREGWLTLHGIEKPVQVEMSFERNGERVKCVSKFKVKLSDHEIAIPSFSGITVANEVDIVAETSVPAALLEAEEK